MTQEMCCDGAQPADMPSGLIMLKLNHRGKRFYHSDSVFIQLFRLSHQRLPLFSNNIIQVISRMEQLDNGFHTSFHNVWNYRFGDNVHGSKLICLPQDFILMLSCDQKYRKLVQHSHLSHNAKHLNAIGSRHHNIQNHSGKSFRCVLEHVETR